MAHLTRIYTRTGDAGRTGLANGSRIDKTSPRMEALGDLDELNAALGLALAWCDDEEIRKILIPVQHRLFDLGGELALPGGERIDEGRVQELEAFIDRIGEALPPLEAFILPGGSPASAQLHVARAVCRRAERSLWRLAARERVNSASLKYLNRLSDLLFVLARRATPEEIPWKRKE